jgi:hypothetical protein
MNQCPPGPQVFHWSLFEFFQIFVEIFANYCLSLVSTAPVNNLYFPSVNDTVQKKRPKSLKFVAGVNDTAEKLFTGVNETADNFFGGVSDTGDWRVLPILACLHLKIKNKQNINL